MTKKGMILSIILAILLLTIIIIVCLQNNKPHKDIGNNTNEMANKEDEELGDFALNVTYNTGFDLEKLKSYSLPIIIQFGSPEEEICKSMMLDIKGLNRAFRKKALVKYIDTDKYQSLWQDERVQVNGKTMQILIDSEGKPFDTEESVALGYRLIKDEEGNHIYTVHDGDLTLEGMIEILNQMGMRK